MGSGSARLPARPDGADARPKGVPESTSALRAIFETALDGVIAVGDDGRVLAWNPQATTIFGWTAAEAIGRPALDLVVPAHLRGVAASALRRAFGEASGSVVARHVEAPARRRDGVEIPVEMSVVVLETEEGRWLSTFVRDLTERREAESRIREGERRLRQIIDLVPHFIFAKDIEGRFLIVNTAVAKAYGTTVDDLLGRKDSDFAKSDAEVEHFRKDDLEVIRGGKAKRIAEETLTDAQGVRRVLETIKIPFEVAGTHAPAVLGVATDITERKRVEAELIEAQKMEGIGRLAGGIAHDFNNLLTAILGYAQIVAAQLPESSAIQHDVEPIREAAERAASLTKQLLTFARRERVEPRVIDLSRLTMDVDRLLRRAVGADIEFVTLPASDLGAVEVDPGQMEQVLVNLVVNARDAMPRGGKLVLSTRNVDRAQLPATFAKPEDDARWVELSVTDTGTGMDDRTLARAFEPFFTTKPPGAGTGLGLATCYGIVKQYGGHLWAESEVGRGSTFRILLPRSSKVPAPRVRDLPEAPPRGHETVLVVDDEESVCDVASRTLEELGYDVLASSTATEAVRIASSCGRPIHLVVADIVMPGMSGPKVAERVLALHPRARELYISGFHDASMLPKGGESGRDAGPPGDFLQKPFTLDTLAVKVRAALDADRLAV